MFIEAMPDVYSESQVAPSVTLDDHAALTLWWIFTKGIPTWRLQVTEDDFSSEEIKTFAGSQTYEERKGGAPTGLKQPKEICYTLDEGGFKKFVDPVQRGYLPTARGYMRDAMKLVLFAKKHEKKYPKQCYVEWGQVPFFSNGLFIVKMVIGENLFEKLKNLLLDCNEANTIKLLKDNDYNFQKAKKAQYHSFTSKVKMYGFQTNKESTLVCLSFFKEVYNAHAHVGLRGGKTGAVQQIYLPTAGAAPLLLDTLVAPTTPKRKDTDIAASCPARTPTGTPPTVQRPRTGSVQVEVEEEKKVAAIHDVQHADIMGMQIPISDSALDSPDHTLDSPAKDVAFMPWKEPVDAEVEQIMETEVDEMSWGDLSKNEMECPDLRRVTEYGSPAFVTSPPRPPHSSPFFQH